jgi:hypothetical protein
VKISELVRKLTKKEIDRSKTIMASKMNILVSKEEERFSRDVVGVESWKFTGWVHYFMQHAMDCIGLSRGPMPWMDIGGL